MEARRRTPIAIYAGAKDELIPIESAHGTCGGWPRVEMKPFIVLFIALAAAGHSESLSFENRSYTYSVYRPSGAADRPAVLLLHGAGGAGRDMLDLWKPFAREHGIVLIAPDVPRELSFEAIAPAFFRALVDGVSGLDRKRIYVFGYSMGGYLAYDAAIFDSEYFAAVAVYADFISPEYTSILKEARRKIPIAIYAGVQDELIPVASVRGTRDLLVSRGFPIHYREFPQATHNYGALADEVNQDAWKFFEQSRLP